MRRALLPLLSAAVLLGLAAGGRAADDDVKAILTKAIKAHGGEEKATKYKAAQVKSKGKVKLPMIGDTEFTQELATMQPDKIKDVFEFSAKGKQFTRLLLFDGEKLVVELNGEEIKLDDKMKDAIKERLKEAGYMGRVARLVPLLKEKEFELSSLGEQKVEGKAAVGVLVKSKGHKDISLFFNKETGLLAKVEHRTTEEGTDKEVTEERIITEYKKTEDGLQMVKKLIIKHDGEKFLEAEVTEAKPLEKLEDSEFKK
jgi:hypothetical protein